MQIEVKGRNFPVTDELREHVEKRFTKVGKQVSELAGSRSSLGGAQSRQPRPQVAEVTLHLKGATLRARDASRDMVHSINLVRRRARAPGQARTATSAAGAARRATAATILGDASPAASFERPLTPAIDCWRASQQVFDPRLH